MLNRDRVDQLVGALRRARERQESFQFTEVHGRLARRIVRADGVQVSFVTQAERVAIEAGLDGAPRSFAVGWLRATWDEAQRCYLARDGQVTFLFVDLPEDPPSAPTVAAWTARLEWLRQNEAALCDQAAAQLERLAPGWSTTRSAIRAGLALSGVTFSGVGVRATLSTGEALGAHSVELEFDAGGQVRSATLAG